MRTTIAAASAAAALCILTPGAAAAPTVAGAERAVKRELRATYGPTDALVMCRKRQTTRREVRYSCDWQLRSDDPVADGYYGIEQPEGYAWVYARRRGAPFYDVVLTD